MPGALPALVFLTIGLAGVTVLAAAEREETLSIAVVPRSESGVFRDSALVYLDGRIDAGAPERLSRALDGVKGKTAIWLNSPGGNLFAGMQIGRIIRKHSASTHIINSRTLMPGECYSACSLAFLGGTYRFNDNGARYGVHRASLGSAGEDADRAQDLSAAVESYIREMGVDARLLDLWMKAASDEMYVLSRKEAEDLGVVNNGKQPPEWGVAAAGGGPRLQGRQVTTDGTGTMSFSCDGKQTVLGWIYEAAARAPRVDARGWSRWLTIDGKEEAALAVLRLSDDVGVARATFALPPDLVRRARFARHIGIRWKPPNDQTPSLGYGVDVDDRSASMVRDFLGNCLRGQAK